MRLISMLFFVLFLTVVSGCGEANTVPGGFSTLAVDDADVVKAAEFAVSEQSKPDSEVKLKSVEKAESQVVAGTNYRLTLVIDEAGTEKTAEVVVYRDLKDAMSVTSWTLKPEN